MIFQKMVLTFSVVKYCGVMAMIIKQFNNHSHLCTRNKQTDKELINQNFSQKPKLLNN